MKNKVFRKSASVIMAFLMVLSLISWDAFSFTAKAEEVLTVDSTEDTSDDAEEMITSEKEDESSTETEDVSSTEMFSESVTYNSDGSSSQRGLLICDTMSQTGSGLQSIGLDSNGNPKSNYSKTISCKSNKLTYFILAYNDADELQIESDGKGGYKFGDELTVFDWNTNFVIKEQVGDDWVDVTDLDVRTLTYGGSQLFGIYPSKEGIYRIYCEGEGYDTASNYVTVNVAEFINIYADSQCEQKLYYNGSDWVHYMSFADFGKVEDFYVTASDPTAERVEFIGIMSQSGMVDLNAAPIEGKYVKTGTPLAQAGYTLNVDSDTNIAKVEIETSVYGTYWVIVKFTYPDGVTEYRNECIHYNEWMKGLLFCDRFFYDEETQKNEFHIIDDGYGIYQNYLYKEDSLKNIYCGEEFPFILAWNENDLVYWKVYGESLSDDIGVIELSEQVVKDKLRVEKLDVNTDTFKAYEGDILFYDENNDCLVLKSSESGTFRIHYLTTGDGSDNAYNFIQFVVQPNTKIFDFYKDSKCTQKIDVPNECVYAYSSGAASAYIKVGDSVSGGKGELVGFIPGAAPYPKDYREDPTNYYTVGTTVQGITLSKPNSQNVSTLTVAPHSVSDVWLVVKFTPVNSRPEYRVKQVHIEESRKGLNVIDEIASPYIGNTPDYANFTTLDDNPYWTSSSVTHCGDCKYYIFGVNESEAVPDNGLNSLQPVTGGLSVKKYENGKETDGSKDCIIKHIESDELPDGFDGLFSIQFNNIGYYRVYSTDGTFVDIAVDMPHVGLYKSNTDFSPSQLVKDVIVTGEEQVFYIRLYDGASQRAGYIPEVEINTKFGQDKAFSFDESNELKPEDGVYKIISNGIPGTLSLNAIFEDEEHVQENCSLVVNCELSQQGLWFNDTVNSTKPTGTVSDANAWVNANRGYIDYTSDYCFELAYNDNIDFDSSKLKVLESLSGLTVKPVNSESDAKATLSYIGGKTFKLSVDKPGDYEISYKDPKNASKTGSVVITANIPPVSFYEASVCQDGEFDFTADKVIDESCNLSFEEARKGEVSFYMLVHKDAYESRGYSAEDIENGSYSIYRTMVGTPDIVDITEGSSGDVTVEAITNLDKVCVDGIEVESDIFDVIKITLKTVDETSLTYIDIKGSFEFEVAGSGTAWTVGPYVKSIHFNKCDLSRCTVEISGDVVYNAGGRILPTSDQITFLYNGQVISNDGLMIFNVETPNTKVGKGICACLFDGADFINAAYGTFNIIPAQIGSSVETRITANPTTSGPIYHTIISDKQYDSVLLKQDVDYKIDYGYSKGANDKYTKVSDKNLLPGKYYAKVTGIGNYSGEYYVEYSYGALSFDENNIVGGLIQTVEYTGNEQRVNPVITVDGYTLVEGVDYKVELLDAEADCINVTGEYIEFNVVGMGKYATYSQTMKLLIKPVDLLTVKGKLTLSSTSCKFGEEPTPKVVVGTKTLELGTDYVVDSFSGEVGKCLYQVVGKGNYTGALATYVTVTARADISQANVILDEGFKVTYTSSSAYIEAAAVTVKLPGSEEVVSGDNYKITTTSVNAGKAQFTVIGKPEKGYTGKKTVQFNIDPANIKDVEWTLDKDTFYYSGKDNKPTVSGTLLYGPYNLKSGTDYTVTYSSAVNAGTYNVTITGKGNFTGTVTKEYVVKKLPLKSMLSDAGFNKSENGREYYAQNSGDVIEIDLTLGNFKPGTDYKVETYSPDCEITANGVKVVAGGPDTPKSYELTFRALNPNICDDWTAKIKVYAYDKTDISQYNVTLNGDYYFTSQAITPSVTVKADETAEPLTAGVDYMVAAENNVNAGKAKLYIIGKGNYTGQIVTDFVIKPANTENGLTVSCSYPYTDYSTGKLVAPTYVLSYNGYNLVEKKDYTISKFTLDEAGNVKATAVNDSDYYAQVTFKGNFTGKRAVKLGKIFGLNLANGVGYSYVTYSGLKDAVYTGKPYAGKTSFRFNNKISLKENTDYTIVYYDNDTGNPVEGIPTDVNEHGYYIKIVGKEGSRCYGEEYTLNLEGNDDDGIFYITKAPMSKVALAVNKSTIKYDDYVEDGVFKFDPVNNAEHFKVLFKSVKFNGMDVDPSEYDIVTENAGKPGSATITLVAKEDSNFTGSITKTFTIDGKVDFGSDAVTVSQVSGYLYYSPAGSVPQFDVKYNGQTLVPGKDYKVTCEYKDPTTGKKSSNKPGAACYATLSGIGKYSGTKADKYRYNVDMSVFYDSDCSKLLEVTNAKKYGDSKYIYATTYTGNAIKYDPKVKYDGKALSLNKDYTVEYYNEDTGDYSHSITEAGSYRLYIGGEAPNYFGTWTSNAYIVVTPADASKLSVSVLKKDYSGKNAENVVSSVKFGKNVLTETVDYKVSLTKTAVKASGLNSRIDENLAAWIKTNYKIDCTHGVEGVPYDCVTPGKKTAYIVGMGNFSGVKEVPYTINGLSISSAKVNSLPARTYNGKEVKAEDLPLEVTYTLKANGKNQTVKLNQGIDYEVSLENNLNAGKCTVTLTGKGRFTGSKKVTFNINPITYSEDGIQIEHGGAMYDGGNGVRPDIVVRDMNLDKICLDEGVDYTVSCSNNKVAASESSSKAPTATIKFKGNYKGTAKVTFTIYQKSVSDLDITVSNTSASGYKVTPNITLNGKKFGTKNDFTYKYCYTGTTVVKRGKFYVTVYDNEEVNPKDTLLKGTKLAVTITGTNNCTEWTEREYYIIK